ncbi:Stk1 family PASTA domain-containing Ser/Thr kinase [Bacillus piscicola]|uniref:Stk1 family PASTA domain-containing Ser/Thr kinase n=1 Tax=Bacillus piscicola TaxID=1632684 RepID=UPI001F09956B|nr:Stk1 family PASTA domain-containing Ser/Thr kinase [Bacillus piscicola]
MSDLIGKRISERYDIEKKIGGGGMAHVYKANDLILERAVAVKVLQPQYNTDDEFIRRFYREAQAATSLAHPHIVNIYDVGEEQQLYYIVMEYIDGDTLKGKIQKEGPLPLAEAAGLMDQVLGAISHAHANQIIHRDIKPHNILLNKSGEAKVTDFGIARAASAATITHTNSVMGSVHYLSPEQAKGGIVTAQSDIYSLGVVLYEMVTGALPYTGDSAVSIALKHLQEPLPLPSEKRPELPQSFENVILKATVKDPQLRYKSVADMQRDLKTALSPERRNESRFEVPHDEEATKAIPIIKDDADDSTKITNHKTIQHNPPPQQAEESAAPKKRRRWRRFLLFFTLFLLAAAIAAFTIIPNMLRVAETKVPDVRNLEEAAAAEELEEAQLKPEIERVFDADVEKDYVISQAPGSGKIVKVDTTVKLYVSDGQKEETVPDVTGLSPTKAEDVLSAYKNIDITEKESTEYPPGQIIEQNPAAGETVIPADTTIYLTSSIEKEFQLENLEGASKEAAENYLKNNHLSGTFESRHSDAVREGRIIEHSPGPYSNVKANDKISFVVSAGPKEPEKENEPEQVEAVVPVEVAEGKGNSFDIRIEYEDATTEGTSVFIEETISETKTYRIPLEITREQPGTYTLYVNDEEVQSNRFNYGDEY